MLCTSSTAIDPPLRHHRGPLQHSRGNKWRLWESSPECRITTGMYARLLAMSAVGLLVNAKKSWSNEQNAR